MSWSAAEKNVLTTCCLLAPEEPEEIAPPNTARDFGVREDPVRRPEPPTVIPPTPRSKNLPQSPAGPPFFEIEGLANDSIGPLSPYSQDDNPVLDPEAENAPSRGDGKERPSSVQSNPYPQAQSPGIGTGNLSSNRDAWEKAAPPQPGMQDERVDSATEPISPDADANAQANSISPEREVINSPRAPSTLIDSLYISNYSTRVRTPSFDFFGGAHRSAEGYEDWSSVATNKEHQSHWETAGSVGMRYVDSSLEAVVGGAQSIVSSLDGYRSR